MNRNQVIWMRYTMQQRFVVMQPTKFFFDVILSLNNWDTGEWVWFGLLMIRSLIVRLR